MHDIKANFNKTLAVVKDNLQGDVNEKGNYKRRGTVPQFSNAEVITLSLIAEYLSINSENYLFSKLSKEYANDFGNIISRRQYNDRRKLLFGKIEWVRKSMAARLNVDAHVFAVDSMPLEICKLSRAARNTMDKELGL